MLQKQAAAVLCLSLLLNAFGPRAAHAAGQVFANAPAAEQMRAGADREFMELLGIKLARTDGGIPRVEGGAAMASLGVREPVAFTSVPSVGAVKDVPPPPPPPGAKPSLFAGALAAIGIGGASAFKGLSGIGHVLGVVGPILAPYLQLLLQLGLGVGAAVLAGYIVQKLMTGGIRGNKIEVQHPKERFKDVAGIDEAVAQMKEIAEILKNPGAYERLGVELPRGVMLYGPPGTGKTLLTKALAGETGIPLLYANGSSFVEVYVGNGAAKIRDLFKNARKLAKKGPVIVMIDEIDSLGQARGGGMGNGGDREYDHALNAMLAEMSEIKPGDRILIVGATNRLDMLDSALIRRGRFDRHISVDPPDVTGRELILKVHAAQLQADGRLAPDIDFKQIAQRTPGLVGSDLAYIVQEAAILAARERRPQVTMADFQGAVDKAILGEELKSRHLSAADKKRVAIHESGHTVAAMFTKGAEAVQRVTIIPRGKALGVTVQMSEEDKRLYTREELEGKLATLLGGMAAEEIFFGDSQVTTGPSSDIEQVRKISLLMVKKFGMSDRVGPIGYEDQGYSPDTAKLLDQESRKLVKETYERVKALVVSKREELQRLSTELEKRETLTGEEVRAALGLPPNA
ncbi:MAG: ATP-dependent zinc metalloprotease FtsH [Elusimicrobia bacterium]|nr:ATP-dependent zinc metalloprotease FtsH [Elusimicrobiota bacterium]